jgi:DNA-binding transcriptional MerR regulator
MLTIGEAARQSGLSADTIRYYERLRVAHRPHRSQGGYRLYDERALTRLRLIRQARAMGLSLDEIRALFARRLGTAGCQDVRDLLTTKIGDLQERIATMIAFKDSLLAYRSRCDRALAANMARCPLFDDDD